MKKQLRQMAINRLKQLPETLKKRIDNDVMSQLIQTPLFKEANTIAITLSQPFEWETRDIIAKALALGKTIAVPKCVAKDKMIFVRYDLSMPTKLCWGIEEPIASEIIHQFDLVVVPGLLFNESGYRLGFGGGYYDRFLAQFQGESVSLLHKSQLIDNLPIDHYDKPVSNLIISEIEV